ncbi:MAG: serine/threonine-protein kinase [Pirellula sp.]
MRLEQHDCSDELLLEILSGEHLGPRTEMALECVEKCEKCRRRLEVLAATDQEWKRANQMLTGHDSSSAFRARHDANSSSGVSAVHRSRAWAESMAQQLLAPASHPEMLGRIGRYEVERLIGSGGMGIVFKAIDTELNRPVAIKVLAPYLAGNGAARQRFSREAKAAAAVVHEHVVPIYNVESDGESPFLVMHFVAGESLQARIDREGALELCEILRIGMQVSSGLQAAHAQGLVHRDIKPSNILLEQGVERSLITDFGLARSADDASLTNTGYHAGTPQYMSPEQARGDSIDSRSDLFSLGSMLYAMCTGRPPFRAETAYGVLRKITDAEPPSIREINPQLPVWLINIVDKLMSKAPDDRYGSAAMVATLFEECLAHVQRPTTYPLPPSLNRTAKTSAQKERVALGVATGIFACVATLTLIASWMGPWITNSRSSTYSSLMTEKYDDPNSDQGNAIQAPTDRTPARRTARPFKIAPDPADEVRQRLLKPANLSGQNMPMQEFLVAIQEEAAIPIDINRNSLTETPFDPTQTISITGTGSVRDVLRRVCDQLDLDYIVHDANIEIASTDYVKQHPVLRYYDLAYAMSDSRDLAALVHAVETMIEPDAWKHNGGASSVAVVESVLVIRATESMHIQLEKLFARVATTLPNN